MISVRFNVYKYFLIIIWSFLCHSPVHLFDDPVQIVGQTLFIFMTYDNSKIGNSIVFKVRIVINLYSWIDEYEMLPRVNNFSQ